MVSYYVYTIGRSKWNKTVRKSEKQIEVDPKIDKIEKHDIIFFYVKEKNMNKFFGWGKTDEGVSKNVYRLKLKKFEDAFNGFGIDELTHGLFDDCTVGFKSERSFKMKYLKENKFIKMPKFKGEKILGEIKTAIKDEDDADVSADESEDYSGYEQSDKEKSDDESEDESDESGDESFDTNDSGEVPIMIDPCEDFPSPTKKFKKFLKHILVCKDCRVLDNGENNFIASFQDVKPIITMKCISTESKYRKYLIPIFDCYERAEAFIIDTRDNNVIKIYYNEMDDTMHFGCYFLVWKMM